MSHGWSENPFLSCAPRDLRVSDAAFYARLGAERDDCGRANHAPNLPPGALAGTRCPRCTYLGEVLAMEAIATLRERAKAAQRMAMKPRRIQGRIVRWTPGNARKALARTPRHLFRNPHPRRVAHFAAAMRAGRWIDDVGIILLSEEGYVLDGQHRLRACARAGKTFHAVTVWGLAVDELTRRPLPRFRRRRGR